MVPTKFDERNEILFNKLVPSSGKADTVEGETLRAINRIIYRHYNDGDYWFSGYGCETAGPAAAFIREFCPIDLREELDESDGAEEDQYQQCLNVMLEKILDYIESKKGQYTPNEIDMLIDCKSKYEPDYEEDY